MALPQLAAPKFETRLPSTGKVIQYRPYLVKEEKILLMALESKDQKQILAATKEVVAACTFGKIDPDKLPVYDIEYLFLKLRAKSVGETAHISLKCTAENCEQYTPIEINLDDVTVDFPAGSKDRVIKLTDSVGVTLKHFDFSAIEKLEEAKTAGAMSVLNELVISSIESIYDSETVYPVAEQSREDLVNFIESLSRQQFDKIQNFIGATPTIKKEVKFTCKCGNANVITLSGLQDFFE